MSSPSPHPVVTTALPAREPAPNGKRGKWPIIALAGVSLAAVALAGVAWKVLPRMDKAETSVPLHVDGTRQERAECPRGVAWIDDRARGRAAVFNGGNQFCATAAPVIDTTQSFTVSAWVKLEVQPGNLAMAAVAQDGAEASGFYLQYSWYHGKWAFNWMEADMREPKANATATSAEPITTEWTHLVGTFDAATKQIQVYVNGKPGKPATIGTPWRASGPLTIGRAKWNGEPANFLRGQLTDVRVWQQVVPPASNP